MYPHRNQIAAKTIYNIPNNTQIFIYIILYSQGAYFVFYLRNTICRLLSVILKRHFNILAYKH